MRTNLERLAIAAVLAIAGCAGHGSSIAPVGGTTAVPASAQTRLVQFRIVVPQRGSTSHRTRHYVSSATASATFSVSPGSAAAVTVQCTSVCTGQISAPIGTDTFTAKLYDASGNVLSMGSMSSAIVTGQINNVNLTFDGVVANAGVTLSPATAVFGTASTSAVTVNFEDADGNTIVGPGTYVDANGNAVTTAALSDSDTSGHTALSATSGSPGSSGISLTYDGKSDVLPIVTATATGIAPASASLLVGCSPGAAQALYEDTFSGGSSYGANESLDQFPLSISGNDVAPNFSSAISIGTSGDESMVFDTGGTLFATGPDASVNYGSLDIDTYCPNPSAPTSPMTAFVAPNLVGEMAIDGARDVYGINEDDSTTTPTFTAFELAAGTDGPPTVTSNSTPTPILHSIALPNDGSGDGFDITVDQPGNVFTTSDGSLYEFLAGPSGPSTMPGRMLQSTTGPGLLLPIANAVDPAGNVYILYQSDNLAPLTNAEFEYGGPFAIAEYAPGNPVSPSRLITGSATQLGTYFGQPLGNTEGLATAISVDAAGNIFVLNSASNSSGLHSTVAEFGPTANGNVAPTATIDLKLTTVVSQSLAVDATDDLYVTATTNRSTTGNLYEYSISGTLQRSLSGNVSGAVADYGSVALDGLGNVAVAATVTPTGGSAELEVLFFGPSESGNAAAVRTISVGSVYEINGIAFDGSQNLYILNGDPLSGFQNAIAKSALRERKTRRHTHRFSKRKRDDGAAGDAAAGPAAPYSMVMVYGPTASGMATPARGFNDPYAFDNIPLSMAVDAAGDVFVGAFEADTVLEYGPSASAQTSPTQAYWDYLPTFNFATISTDSAGNLYATSNGLAEYAPGATTPLRTIYGPKTLMAEPGRATIDAAGNVYVREGSINAVLVFGPGQSGNVAPMRVQYQYDSNAFAIGLIAVGPPTIAGTTAQAKARTGATR